MRVNLKKMESGERFYAEPEAEICHAVFLYETGISSDTIALSTEYSHLEMVLNKQKKQKAKSKNRAKGLNISFVAGSNAVLNVLAMQFQIAQC